MKILFLHQQVNSVTDSVLTKIKVDNQNTKDKIKGIKAKLFNVFRNCFDIHIHEDQEISHHNKAQTESQQVINCNSKC